MTLLVLLACQALFTFEIEGDGPVRFGMPIPAKVVSQGLRLSDASARLQWRPLHEAPDPETGRLWIELAVVGAHGRQSVYAGGVGPVGEGGGAVVRSEAQEHDRGAERVRIEHWRWCTGERDQRVRRHLLQTTVENGETFAAGESLTTVSPGFDDRWLRVSVGVADWRRAGVLPAAGSGSVVAATRERLRAIGRTLQELPGQRGAGDYGRSDDVVTNLEFDTAVGLARLGLVFGDADLLRRALRGARHLIDHDLDPQSGLPFCHGRDHRGTPPEPGHVWLSGLLLVGCLAADDRMIKAAASIARSLARHPPLGEGRNERARDFGWPLLELETWLRFEPDPACAKAADALGLEWLRRWDPVAKVVRFGEGVCRNGAYEERAWIIGGVALPALRAHALRRPSPAVRTMIEALERRTLALVLEGREGLPVRYWVQDGGIDGVLRLPRVPEHFLLLEGLSEPALTRCLGRSVVGRALRDVPALDDPDLATSWSMAARCRWILR